MQLVHELAEDEFEIYPFIEGFRPAHPPSISTIRRVWNTYFPHVVQPNMSEFGSCGRCHELLARLKAARGRDEEFRVRRDIEAHPAACAAQREFANIQLFASRKEPGQQSYIQIDYTMPTMLPSFRPRSSVRECNCLLLF